MSDFMIENGILTLYKGHDADVIIPDGIKIIGRRAFYGNRDIESVTIPASVEEIEQGAFEYCYNLKKVTFLGSVKKVGVHAFGWISSVPELELQVYNSVAIHALTKSAQGDGVSAFCRRFSELDKNSEVFRDNLEFIGTHLKQKTGKVGRMFYEYLIKNDEVRHAVMEADAIPAKDAEWLVAQLQPDTDGEFIAEILDYKNRILKDPKKKNSLEKSKAREAEKELSVEMTAADWRRIFKFSYADGDVVIKETKISDRTVTVPAHIGTKKVRIIDRGAFSFPGGNKSPEKIIISKGIEEIRRGAFMCVDNSEIFIPDTVTSLPEATFIAVHNLIVHLPMAITEIAEELEWDSPEPAIREIHAPAGSYAEKYAKEHNIPFVAE